MESGLAEHDYIIPQHVQISPWCRGIRLQMCNTKYLVINLKQQAAFPNLTATVSCIKIYPNMMLPLIFCRCRTGRVSV